MVKYSLAFRLGLSKSDVFILSVSQSDGWFFSIFLQKLTISVTISFSSTIIFNPIPIWVTVVSCRCNKKGRSLLLSLFHPYYCASLQGANASASLKCYFVTSFRANRPAAGEAQRINIDHQLSVCCVRSGYRRGSQSPQRVWKVGDWGSSGKKYKQSLDIHCFFCLFVLCI